MNKKPKPFEMSDEELKKAIFIGKALKKPVSVEIIEELWGRYKEAVDFLDRITSKLNK